MRKGQKRQWFWFWQWWQARQHVREVSWQWQEEKVRQVRVMRRLEIHFFFQFISFFLLAIPSFLLSSYVFFFFFFSFFLSFFPFRFFPPFFFGFSSFFFSSCSFFLLSFPSAQWRPFLLQLLGFLWVFILIRLLEQLAALLVYHHPLGVGARLFATCHAPVVELNFPNVAWLGIKNIVRLIMFSLHVVLKVFLFFLWPLFYPQWLGLGFWCQIL